MEKLDGTKVCDLEPVAMQKYWLLIILKTVQTSETYQRTFKPQVEETLFSFLISVDIMQPLRRQDLHRFTILLTLCWLLTKNNHEL